MSSLEHREAMDLAAQAGLLVQAGRSTEAAGLYKQAADWEQKAFDQLAPGRPRTRSILGISLVSLLYKARAYARAGEMAKELLDQADLPASRRREVAKLIEAIERELAVNGSMTREKASVRPQG